VLEPNGDAASATTCCHSLPAVDATAVVCCPWHHHCWLIATFDFSMGLTKAPMQMPPPLLLAIPGTITAS